MPEAFICSYYRTPIGRFGGALASVRPDDLCAVVLKQILAANPNIPSQSIDEVVVGCANQAGEDNRNVARMSLLLAGFPHTVPGSTINRLCGSGMDSTLNGARLIQTGDADLVVAGGVESMSRAPLVMPKAYTAYSRAAEIFDTTIGWRFVNPRLDRQYGTHSMPETAENVAAELKISREDQDLFALRSQLKAARRTERVYIEGEIVPVSVPQRKGDPIIVANDEHPRETTMEKLARLPTPFRHNGTVTAGNSSGVNDGAAALLLASEAAITKYDLTPMARIVGGATAGVEPRIMGIGPVPATQKLCQKHGLNIDQFDVIELNEAFASQSLASLRMLGIKDDDRRVNQSGGAIALGHPLGMSGTRITGLAAMELYHQKKTSALATMCIGVGQGIAIALISP